MISLKIPYIIYPLAVGLMAGWLVSSIIGSTSVSPKSLPIPKIKREVKRINPNDMVKNIVEKNIFGLLISPVSVASTQSGGETNGVQAAPFDGKLIGLIQNPKNKDGIAIITTEGLTLSIKTGAEKNGLKLVSIDNITAIIEKNKKNYAVRLEGGDNPINNASSSAATPAVQSSGSNLNVGIKRAEIQAELKDLNKILQSALVSPQYTNGEFAGYRVTRMKDDSPLKKLGLNQGDIITRINGSELKTPEILFNMLSQIDDISAISIDMIRDNDKKTLFVELQ